MIKQNKDEGILMKVAEKVKENGGEMKVRFFHKNKIGGCKNSVQAHELAKRLQDKGFGEIEFRSPPNGGQKSKYFVLFD